MFNEYAISRLKKGMKVMDGEILSLENNQRGIYETNAKDVPIVKVFDDEKSKKATDRFLRFPQDLRQEIEYNQGTMIPTGPVLGHNLLVSAPKTEAGEKDQGFLQNRKINDKVMKVFKEMRVFGLRRALRVFPTDIKLTYQKDDLLLMFTLPSGSYASVLIDEMLGMI